MFLNYLLIAFRNLKKQRGYAIVSTAGLSIGLASALFIFLYVQDELTFDTYHPHAKNTYRLGYRIEYPNGESEAYPAAPAGWDNYIKETYSGIGAITSFNNTGMPTSIYYEPKDRIVLTEDIIWAEPNFQEVLALPIAKGDPTPLKEINSIILSESAAEELFGDEDPINKQISIAHQWQTNGQKIPLQVTAVYKDPPSNTHIRPKYIVNIFSLKEVIPQLESLLNESMGEGENNYWTQSFFVCTNESQIPLITNDLQKRANEIIARFNLPFKFKPLIAKITDVHFDQQIDWSISTKSVDPKYIYVFISIAFLILVVACINYINLSTAKSANRAREIGLRKTFGGVRPQLFFQFMSESFVMVFISTLIALLLVILFMPQFNDLTGKSFTIQHIFDPQMLVIIAGVIVLVTLLAGSYPAIFVSGFQPVSVLKGKFAFGKGSHTLRQVLTTVQFIVAVTLLSGTVIVVRQMDLMRNSKLNEAGNQIISIRYGGFTGPATDQRYLVYKNLVVQDAEIESVTLANHLPRLDYFGPISMRMQFPDINEDQHEWFQLNGDYDFPRTFGMKVIAGRDFDPKNVADSTAVLLNQAAVKALKITPEEAVGKRIIRPDYVMGYGPPDSTRAPVSGLIIGVVEDFPYRSMHRKIDPLAISPKPHTNDRIIHVRLPAGKVGEKIVFLEKKWKEVFPGFGFDYWFIDEEFGRMYENETKVAALTEQFSLLAILITCVGLYGLASYLSEQRTKEIGIRKTLGASNFQILFLLLRVFTKLLLIACVIGVPIAFYVSSRWLESFAYQTSLSIIVFAGAVLLIAAITLITVGYESLKASMANPIKALKHE
jgi:putative ABC transport system permease protein